MYKRLPSCKITGAILVAAVLFMFMLANAPKAEAVGSDRPVTRSAMRPCLSDEGESAFACVWMASVMGNKSGHSFRIFKDGRVKLISERRAFELLGECDSNGPLYCRTAS